MGFFDDMLGKAQNKLSQSNNDVYRYYDQYSEYDDDRLKRMVRDGAFQRMTNAQRLAFRKVMDERGYIHHD